MIADLFAPPKTPDPLNRAADERSGAYSVLVGIAANQSSGQPPTGSRWRTSSRTSRIRATLAMPNPRAHCRCRRRAELLSTEARSKLGEPEQQHALERADFDRLHVGT